MPRFSLDRDRGLAGGKVVATKELPINTRLSSCVGILVILTPDELESLQDPAQTFSIIDTM